MEIDNVRKEDSGTYICTASNNVGTISADQIELKVLCKFFSHLFYHALCGKIFSKFSYFFPLMIHKRISSQHSLQEKILIFWIMQVHPSK